MVKAKEWTHLGDGVYAMFDLYGVWLHANDHRFPTDRIYLEHAVIKNLDLFLNLFYKDRGK